jgi:hypothetical protein
MRLGRIVAAVWTLALPSATAHGACNSIPQLEITPTTANLAAAPTPTATPLYYGRMGTIDQPFVAPANAVMIQRRSCDQGSPIVAGVTPLVTVVLNARRTWDGTKYRHNGEPRAFLIESDVIGCDSAKVDACDLGLNGILDGDAKCIEVPAAQYQISADAMTFPFPDPAETFAEFRSGAVSIAVTRRISNPPCHALAKKTCLDALPVNKLPTDNWHACIDELYDQDLACHYSPVNPTFRHLTLLPAWNNARLACFARPELCTGAADEFRYSLDVDGNLLIPVSWDGLLRTCNGPCGFPVRGDLIPPNSRFLRLPENAGETNSALQSFTPEGFPLAPMTLKQETTTLGEGLAISGTADGPFSVLRISSVSGRCEDGSGTLHASCRHTDDCAADETCVHACVGGTKDGEKCTAQSDCPGKAKCGERHNMEGEFKDGRWRLVRTDPKFYQEPLPSQTCAASNATLRCVSYQLKVDAAFDLPTPTVTPTPVLVPVDLQDALGSGAVVDPEQVVASEPVGDSTWVAAFVDRPPTHHAAGHAVAVARTRGCAQGTICELRFLALGGHRAVKARPAIAFVGSQVRLLVEDPGTGEPGWLGRVFGGRRDPASRQSFPILMLYDAAQPITRSAGDRAPEVQPVAVGYVDLSDRAHYDPLRRHPSGSTTFLSPAGRCRRAGEVLPIPSICRPGNAPGTCPPGATCTATSVVVAMDLTTDRDGDGVPDTLRPPAPERGAPPPR